MTDIVFEDGEERKSATFGDHVRYAIGAAGFAYASLWIGHSVDAPLGLYVGMAIGFVWLCIDLFAHELGHALAAKLCGWRIYIFAVGPIAYHLFNRDFAILRRKERDEAAGYVLVAPGNPEVWTTARKNLISASGAFASFVLAAFLWRAGDGNFIIWPADDGIGTRELCQALALISASSGLVNILPFGVRDHDGARIWARMNRGERETMLWRAVGCIHGLLNYQVRLRDLPMWMVDEQRAIGLGEGNPFQIGRLSDQVDIGIVLDSAPVDRAKARALLDRHLADYGDSEWLAGCDAYFTAIWEKDGEAARRRLWQGDKVAQPLDALTLAAEAAVAARLGNVDVARTKLALMRSAAARKSPFPDHTFMDIADQVQHVIEGLG